jgi:hypothetical protein
MNARRIRRQRDTLWKMRYGRRASSRSREFGPPNDDDGGHRVGIAITARGLNAEAAATAAHLVQALRWLGPGNRDVAFTGLQKGSGCSRFSEFVGENVELADLRR